MPKGVEHHSTFPARIFMLAVSSSVMPKGVEHSWWIASAVTTRIVSSSVMPKGVEHLTPKWWSDAYGPCRVQ